MYMNSRNILISVNDAYVKHCIVMLSSYFRHNSSNSTIYLLYNHINYNKYKELETFILSHNSRLVGIKLSLEDVELPKNIDSRFSEEVYYRIVASKLLPQNIDRALWLDSDLIVLGDISNLYDMNFDGKSIIACRDFNYDSNSICSLKKELGLENGHDYFNSGVILFNLRKIRKNPPQTQMTQIIKRIGDKIVYPDQDILNLIYTSDVKYTNRIRYNFQTNLTNDVDADNLGIICLHYAGNKKPWDPLHSRNVAKYYWNEAKIAGFRKEWIMFVIKHMAALPYIKYKRSYHKNY